VVFLVVIAAASGARAFAQFGSAGMTGVIQRSVVDTSGGVLPGVTVTAASPSMIGTQAQTTRGRKDA
jgi:hypothetical protein